MKQLYISLIFFMLFSISLLSQTGLGGADSKLRFGLRFNPQVSWYSSNNKNTVPNGAVLGYGFGLNLDYKLSEVASILTGIGGDFESGKIKYKNDPTNNFQLCYFKNDASDLFIQPKNNSAISDLKKSGNTLYLLKERKVSTSFVTIPIILKLSTKEINGMKYFGLFGLELGIRIKSKANDSFYDVRKYTSDSTYDVQQANPIKDIDIGSDASLIPMRLGLNVGLGAEYRLAGTTSFFGSVNFFNSFTNLMKNDSKYLITNWQNVDAAKGNTTVNYKMMNQNLLLNAVRINLGFMF